MFRRRGKILSGRPVICLSWFTVIDNKVSQRTFFSELEALQTVLLRRGFQRVP